LKVRKPKGARFVAGRFLFLDSSDVRDGAVRLAGLHFGYALAF